MTKTTTQLSVFLAEKCRELGLKPHDVSCVLFGSEYNSKYGFAVPNFSLKRVIRDGSRIHRPGILEKLSTELKVPLADLERMNNHDVRGRKLNNNGKLDVKPSKNGHATLHERVFNSKKVEPTVTAHAQTAIPVPAKASAKSLPEISGVKPSDIGTVVAEMTKSGAKVHAQYNQNTERFDIFVLGSKL
jgi:hypothetical protein